MSAHNDSIEALVTAVARFLRDDGCRLLQVLASAELHRQVLAVVMAQEHRPTSRAPFVALQHAHTAAMPAWSQRAEFARVQHERRRDGAPATIAALPDAPVGRDERLVFALQLQQLLQAPPPGTEGLVAVLACAHIDAPAVFRESVAMLVGRRELGAVRWIVIETDGDALGPLVATLGARAQQVDTRLPEAAADAELAALVDDRPPASPRGVTPPARPDVPVRVPDADGLRRREIGRLSLAAALASSRGRGAEAVTAQRDARDLATQAGWTGDAVTMELALGAHLVGAGATREAEVTFLRAIDTAKQHGMDDKATTAGFGLAATRTIRGERHTALVAYADAALAAQKSGSPMLAIEANRLAGQAALELRMEPQAITFFAKAVGLAAAAPREVGRSSAAVAARSLADLCRKRGMHGRADELEAQAVQFSDGAPPDVATATVPPPVMAAAPASPAVPASPAAASPPAANPAVPANAGAAPDPAGAVAAGAPAPSPAASAPAFVPFDEGTGMLTLDQIARVHMRGVASSPVPPESGARSWTRDEIQSLQRAVDHSLGDDASRILSRDELTALQGRAVVDDDTVARRDEPGSVV